MKYAKLNNDGVVIQVQPNWATGFVEVSDNIVAGMVRKTNGQFAIPLKPLSDLKVAKIAELAAARYNEEVGGIAINGVKIATDRETQAKLTAAYVRAVADANLVLTWKTSNGEWAELDSTIIIAAGNAAFALNKRVFQKEKDLTVLAQAATSKTQLSSIAW
jgi:hypothetical protein